MKHISPTSAGMLRVRTLIQNCLASQPKTLRFMGFVVLLGITAGLTICPLKCSEAKSDRVSHMNVSKESTKKPMKELYERECRQIYSASLGVSAATALCGCRSAILPVELDPSSYEALLAEEAAIASGASSPPSSQSSLSQAPLADARTHAGSVVAPCQFIAFQRNVIEACQAASSLAIYRRRNDFFCVCYALERTQFMKDEMPLLIIRILTENPYLRDPFASLYGRPEFRSALRQHIAACL